MKVVFDIDLKLQFDTWRKGYFGKGFERNFRERYWLNQDYSLEN
jgi:hypothetical protein